VAKMAKQIARLLRTDIMADIDIPAIAQFLQSQGRRGDTILAHINAKEAEMLRNMGGAEERNPVTGLPEYFSIDDYGSGYGADYDQSVASNNVRLANEDMFYSSPRSESSDYYTRQIFEPARDRELPITIESDPRRYAGELRMDRPNRDELLDRYSVPGLRMDRPDVQGVRDFGGSALAPDLTIPERPSAATLGPAALDARMRADRELSRERGAPGMMDRASAATGLSKEALARLGLAGLGTIQGVMAARRAGEQGREARRETEALARPYQERGQQLTQQAQEGQLDQLMLGAIRTGLEADRYAAGLSNTYFTNMASIAAGMPVQAGGAQ